MRGRATVTSAVHVTRGGDGDAVGGEDHTEGVGAEEGDAECGQGDVHRSHGWMVRDLLSQERRLLLAAKHHATLRGIVRGVLHE